MVFSISVQTNIASWSSKWNARRKALEKDLNATPKKVAEWGSLYAKGIAPRDTTALVQSIAWSGADKKATVFLRTGVSNPDNKIPTTRYGYIMHITPKSEAEAIWTSGNPHFMFTMRKRASEKFNRDVRIAVGQFIGKQPV